MGSSSNSPRRRRVHIFSVVIDGQEEIVCRAELDSLLRSGKVLSEVRPLNFCAPTRFDEVGVVNVPFVSEIKN